MGCLSLIIFVGGPYIEINRQYPLLSFEKRFYLIALFILVMILFSLLAPKKKAPSSQQAFTSPEDATQLQNLKLRFEGAFQFLKKTFITKYGKNVSLDKLPWFLFIGPQGAGKTTLLANSNINFVLTKQFKQEKITPSTSFDWWATRDCVFVDAAGVYLKEKNFFLLDSFFKLTEKFRGPSGISKVMVALPLPELMKQKNISYKKQIALEIKTAITNLQKQLGSKIIFYFIITKCDCLPGFLEFFGDTVGEDLSQAWGITLPTLTENENLINVFANRFNTLIKRLNTQLITRLHQERNSNLRSAIKDFPLHVERLKENMVQFLKALNLPELNLHGVYLTSATQSTIEEPASQIINANAHQALQLLRPPSQPTKCYFTRQLLLQGIFSNADAPVAPAPPKKWRQYLSYATSVVAVIFITGLLVKDFEQSVFQTYAIQNNLAQYRFAIEDPNHKDRLIKALPLLNALQASAKNTNNKYAHLLSFYSDKSQKTAATFYEKALQTIAIPEIKNAFENYLRDSEHKNLSERYAALKAYLMLGHLKDLQVDYITQTLKKTSLQSLNSQTLDELASHINTAFSKANKPLLLDQKLIEEVREEFTNLSALERAFILLENMTSQNGSSTLHFSMNIGKPPIFTDQAASYEVPNLYTSASYHTIMSQQMTSIATEALQGNDIFGHSPILSNDATIHTLTAELRPLYIKKYVATWEHLLSEFNLIKTTQLAQIDKVITTLMSSTSPLLQFLQTIKQNTSHPEILQASPKLSALNNLLTRTHNTEEDPLFQIFVSLRQLHFYLQNILTAQNVSNAAFEAAKIRLQNANDDVISQLRLLGQNHPEPLKGWLVELANQSWGRILQEASHAISNAWEVNVMPVYQSQFRKGEDHEMDLQQVASFISKQGILANFYSRYLQPFVNESTTPWQWKVVDNQSLPLPLSLLGQIQEASKLQNISRFALFSQGRKNLSLKQLQLPEKLLNDE